MPGFARNGRLERRTSLAALQVYALQVGFLGVGGAEAVILADKRVWGIGEQMLFLFSSRRRHTTFDCDWSSDVCSSDLGKLDTQILTQLGRPGSGCQDHTATVVTSFVRLDTDELVLFDNDTFDFHPQSDIGAFPDRKSVV